MKNGRVISTTSNDQLVINVAANDTHTFGQYECVVNNSVITTDDTFFIKQKGDNYCNADTYHSMGYSDIGRYFGMGELSKSCMHKHAAAGGGAGGMPL